MKRGTIDIDDIKRGGTDIEKVYRATELIWERLPDGFPLWTTNNVNGSQFLTALSNFTSTATFSSSSTEINSVSGGSADYYSMCLGPDGTTIYMMPFDDDYVKKYDTLTDTFSDIGSVISGNRISAALAPNGKIYSFPFSSGVDIIEVDPATDTTSVIAQIPAQISAGAFIGAVTAENGKVYGIPYFSNTIAEIDTIAGTVSFLPCDTDSASDTNWSGALAPNGKIYCAPSGAGQVLEIDPETGTYQRIGTPYPYLGDKWAGATLAPNGKIYCVPLGSVSTILEIDPETGTTTTFGSLGSSKFRGSVLGPNGKIYGIPSSSSQVVEIDPDAQTATLVGDAYGTSSNKWFGGVLAKNGKIYGGPLNRSSMLIVGDQDKNLDTNMVLSRYLNKN